MASPNLYTEVHDHYSRLARETVNDETEYGQKAALSFGYSAEELSSIPEGANLGVSCGNPLAVAGLREGEIVVDLGCGAGFDVFLAARKVGSSGLAIGVDMSKDMLARANLNASKSSITNIKFVESSITSIALESSSANCIISNCVINLVPLDDKHLVFEEVFRILKPGGRLAVSDILGRKAMPDELLKNMSLYVGCIAGASMVHEYETYLKDAGFKNVLIVDKKNDLNIYKEGNVLDYGETESGKDTRKEQTSSCCTPKVSTEESSKSVVGDVDFNEWVGSFSIYAVKP